MTSISLPNGKEVQTVKRDKRRGSDPAPYPTTPAWSKSLYLFGKNDLISGGDDQGTMDLTGIVTDTLNRSGISSVQAVDEFICPMFH